MRRVRDGRESESYRDEPGTRVPEVWMGPDRRRNPGASVGRRAAPVSA